jgi:hypothetical protein
VPLIGYLSVRAYLRFRRSASRYIRLANLYSAVGIALLRNCYGQILGDAVIFRSSPAVFGDGTSTRNLIWQATESYMERGDAFGLVPHKLYDIAQPIMRERLDQQGVHF